MCLIPAVNDGQSRLLNFNLIYICKSMHIRRMIFLRCCGISFYREHFMVFYVRMRMSQHTSDTRFVGVLTCHRISLLGKQYSFTRITDIPQEPNTNNISSEHKRCYRLLGQNRTEISNEQLLNYINQARRYDPLRGGGADW